MRQNNINCTHYFSTYQIFFTFSCGEFFPHDNLSCGEFLHLTICYVDKFLHMTKNFSTGTARGARDKYEVCAGAAVTNIQVLEVFQAGGSLGHILWRLDESENFFLTISGLRQESRLRQFSLECLRMQFCCWFWMDEIGRKCL